MKNLAILAMLLGAAQLSCGKSDLYFNDFDSETDIDVDNDTDTDIDTDTDTDVDTDTDIDTDTDSDTDTDTDTDIDTDTDSDTDTDTDGECDGVPIVSQTEETGSTGSSNPLMRYGQTFIPWADYITDLELWLYDSEGDVGPVTIELRADANGCPEDTALASVEVDVAFTWETEPYCASFAPVSVIPDDTYWIVLNMAEDAGQYGGFGGTGWGRSGNNPYPEGSFYFYNFENETWNSDVGRDFTFNVYGIYGTDI